MQYALQYALGFLVSSVGYGILTLLLLVLGSFSSVGARAG